MNLYEKMSKATDKIGTVAKSLKIGTGNYAYKAVSERDIISAVKEVEKEFGILSYPSDSKVIESFRFPTGNDKESFFIRIETTYRFVNIEDPKEFIEVKGYGDGIDSQDKATGKALTYAGKYALSKAYKIETGDDLDEKPSDDLAGHNVFKIKERIEKTITAKIQKGMEMPDVLSALKINQKQLDAVLNYFGTINGLENSINKL